MANANLVLSYMKTLVWPIIVITVLIIFRNPLKALLGAIEEFEGFGVRAKIGQRLTQAAADAEQALDQDPPYMESRHPANPLRPTGRNWGGMRETASRMMVAVKFTTSPGGTVDAHSVERMRRSVEALDVALNAVLVVVATSGWHIPVAEQSTVIRATWVESQLFDLTGFRGWGGIIRSRNILRNTLSSVCGKSTRRVSAREVIMIVGVADRTLNRLRQLVSDFADSLNLDA